MKKHTELNKGKFSELLGRFQFLENVKVIKRRTLFDFEPDWELVRQNLCGHCGKPLRVRQNGTVAFCGRKSCFKKYGQKFVITVKKLAEIKLNAR